MLADLYLLDLLGVFAFALFGAYIGLKKQFDLFGIFICAFLSSFGGGTIREMILGKIPLYFTDYNYLYAVVFGVISAIILYKHFQKVRRYFLYIDAIGLATFAFIGAQRADEYQLGNLAIVFFAMITAVGGGIMRDIAVREVPYVFHKDFYASPAIILGVVYVLFRDIMNTPFVVYGLILAIFFLRVAAIHLGFRLWSRSVK